MARLPLPVVGSSYLGRSTNFESQRTVNFYPEVSGSGSAKSVAALIGCPGAALFVAVGTGPIRAAHVVASGRVFVLSGNQLFELFSGGTSILRASVSTVSGPAAITDNGVDLVIGDGATFSWFSLNDGTSGPVAGAPAGWSCEYLDQAIFMVEANTGKLWYSEVGDARIVDGLNFVTAESAPDNLLAVVVDRQQLWLMGTETVEVWTVTGGSDNFIERYPGGVLQAGCVSGRTAVQLDNSIFWVGRDDKGRGMVWRDQGYTPARVSTHAVEYWLAKGNLEQAYSWAYQQEGHTFYVCCVPGLTTSWVFDAATGEWHERGWLNTTTGFQELHRGTCQVAAFGKTLVGDRETGQVFSLQLDLATDAGVPLVGIRRTSHSWNNLARFQTSMLQLDMETGVGLDGNVQGSDPEVMMRFSDDGGHTWSGEKRVSAGKIGKFRQRAKWNRLGQSRDRVYEFSISDPVKRVLLGAFVEVEAANG